MNNFGESSCNLFLYYVKPFICLYVIILHFLWNQGVKKCVKEVGIGFMMAPKYHPAMKVVSPVRKKLKVKTVFNILGPMLNPAQVPFAVVGVYNEDLVRLS